MDDLMAQGLADAVGATKRQVQTWTDAGILLCRPETDRGGPGIRRKYPREELSIAALITALSRFKIPIGDLIIYGSYFRWFLLKKRSLKYFQTQRACGNPLWIIAYPLRGAAEDAPMDLVSEDNIVLALSLRMGVVISAKEVTFPA